MWRFRHWRGNICAAAKRANELGFDRRLLARELEQFVRHSGYLRLSLQYVGLASLSYLVASLGNPQKPLEDQLVFLDQLGHFERKAQIDIGGFDAARNAVHGFLVTVTNGLRILGGDVLAQTTFARIGQVLGQTNHFHRHILAVEGRRCQGRVDHPRFEHRIIERSRRRYSLAGGFTFL